MVAAAMMQGYLIAGRQRVASPCAYSPEEGSSPTPSRLVDRIVHLFHNSSVHHKRESAEASREMYAAVYYGRTQKVASLYNQDPSLLDTRIATEAMTLLHLAAKNGHHTTAAFLCEKKPSLLSIGDTSGFLPIHYAAQYGHTKIVSLMHRLNPSLHVSSNVRELHTLHLAAQRDHIDTVTWLQENVPSLLSRKSAAGWNALHLAAYNDSRRALIFLHQQDPSLLLERNEDGLTPIDLAIARGHPDPRTFLQKSVAMQKC